MKSQNEVYWTDQVDSFGNPLLSDEVPQKPSQSKESPECEFCKNKATRTEFFDGEIHVCDKCSCLD